MLSDRASPLLRITATLGLLFLHLPILLIFLYAFTTEERTYQFPPPGLTIQWFAAAWARCHYAGNDVTHCHTHTAAAPPLRHCARALQRVSERSVHYFLWAV